MNTSHLTPVSVVRRAARLVDTSGVTRMLTEWDKHDQKHRGGRRTTLSTRAVLIAWVAVALEHAPLHKKRVAEVLTIRLSPETADILGVPHAFTGVDPADMFERVHRATTKFLDLMDYKPIELHRQRALRVEEWERVLASRALRSEELECKRRRMFRFSNAFLRTQYDSLPENVRTDSVSLSIDATFLSAFGVGFNEPASNHRGELVVPSEPDAAWYVRKYESSGRNGGKLKKRGYGWEFELASLISNDPALPRAVPHIVIGFNQHPATRESNERAREIFEDIYERGLTIDHAIGDQAYFPGANPEMLQNWLRRKGAKLVMKYAKKPDLRHTRGEGSIQAEANGGHLIEGHWYCPAMQAALRGASLNYRKAVAADNANPNLTRAERAERKKSHRARRDAQIAERRRWELSRKEKPDTNGAYPMTCPAIGAARTLSCPLKPNQPPLKAGLTTIPVLNPPAAPGKICTNQSSVKFNLDDGGKYEQHYRYRSVEWQQAYSYGRQVIESFNRSLKHAANALHDSSSRRMRGEVAQTFLALLGVIAANEDRIENWLEEHYNPAVSAPAALTRQRRTPRPTTKRPAASRKSVSAARRAQLGLDREPVSA